MKRPLRKHYIWMWIVAAPFIALCISELFDGEMVGAVLALIIALVLAVPGYFNFKKNAKARNAAKAQEQQLEQERQQREQWKRTHKRTYFNIAGVTHVNSDGTERQKVLKTVKKMDKAGEPVALSFEPYQYHGAPAIYVKFNDMIAGNVPKEDVAEMLAALGSIEYSEYDISSFKNEYDERIMYCKVSVTYRV